MRCRRSNCYCNIRSTARVPDGTCTLFCFAEHWNRNHARELGLHHDAVELAIEPKRFVGTRANEEPGTQALTIRLWGLLARNIVVDEVLERGVTLVRFVLELGPPMVGNDV